MTRRTSTTVSGGIVCCSDGQQTTTPSVQRCESTPSQARPEYWDVSYNFRGQEHRVQMSTPPGPTLIVNEQGEPRV
jgi:uncharacterized protein YcfJ